MNHNMKKIVIIHGHIFINGLWYIAGSDLLLLKGVVCFSDTYVLNSVKSQPHYQLWYTNILPRPIQSVTPLPGTLFVGPS